MNPSPLTFWHLLAYVKGELSAEDQRETDEHLLENAEAWEVVVFLEKLRQSGELEDYISRNQNKLNAKLRHSVTSLPAANPGNSALLRKKPFLLIAASVALVLISVTAILWPSAPSGEKLFSQYYQPYSFVQDVSRGHSTEGATIDQQLLRLYRAGEYSKVIDRLQSADTLDYPENLVLVSAYLSTEQFDKAEAELENMNLQYQDHQVFPDSFWYRALVFLQKGEKQRTITELQKLLEHPQYKAQAKALLEELPTKHK